MIYTGGSQHGHMTVLEFFVPRHAMHGDATLIYLLAYWLHANMLLALLELLCLATCPVGTICRVIPHVDQGCLFHAYLQATIAFFLLVLFPKAAN
jgi:hypothetical protein